MGASVRCSIRSRSCGSGSRTILRPSGRVVDLHSLVLGWYDDRDVFQVGYLIAVGRTFEELFSSKDRVECSRLHWTTRSASLGLNR